jgi:hypothetical protein
MGRLQGLSRGGRVLLALAIGGAVFGIATAVQASIPDANGVIHGCYNTSLAHGNPTGALRVIDTSAVNGHCANWEAPLNWSAAAGVTGATGATGATGPTGPTGPTGATGATGPSGTTGPSGPSGPTGPAGVPGLAITDASLTIPGPTGVTAFIGCGDSAKIAIGATVWDSTSAANTTMQGSGNDGELSGGAPSDGWDLEFALGSTAGDTLQFQIVCANPPVGTAAPVRGSSSTSKPTVKITTHSLP